MASSEFTASDDMIWAPQSDTSKIRFPQSPSLGSISTNCGVTIKIKDHERKGDEYVVFIIEVQATNPDIIARMSGVKSWNVSRRYSDFDMLKATLEASYPSCLIPPLPDKFDSYMPWRYANQKYDTEFIEGRRLRLESFLQRILAHPQLSQDEVVLQFILEGDTWRSGAKSKDLPKKLTNYVSRRVGSLRLRNSPPAEVRELQSRGEQLHANIARLLTNRRRVAHHAYGVHKLHKNYGEALCDWCGHERRMADALQTLGHLIDTYSSLMDCVEEEEAELEGRLTEYLRYAGCLIDLCRRHEAATIEMEREEDLLTGLRRDRSQFEEEKFGFGLKAVIAKFLGTGTPAEREQVLEKMAEAIHVSEERLAQLQTKVREFTGTVSEELVRFESEKRADLQRILHSYATLQLQRSQRCLRLWSQADQAFQECPASSTELT